MLPREKFQKLGIAGLTDEDLASLIIGSGVKGADFKSISKSVIKLWHKKTGDLNFDDLSEIHGMGEALSLRLLAVFELGSRLYGVCDAIDSYIRSTNDAVPFFSELKGRKREYVRALYLDARFRLVKSETLAIGTISSVGILPRDVIIPALENNSAYIIIGHNHPSGNPSPSQADILFTKRLQEACGLIGIQLIDHLIIGGDGKWCSINMESSSAEAQ